MSRINITDMKALTTAARRTLLDGIIKGEGIADIVAGILMTASAFGADEFERGGRIPATAIETNFDDLKVNLTEFAVNIMFSGSGNSLKRIVDEVTLAGAAFGFQNTLRQKGLGEVYKVIQKTKSDPSVENIDALADLISALPTETKISALRRTLQECKITGADSEKFKNLLLSVRDLMLDA